MAVFEDTNKQNNKGTNTIKSVAQLKALKADVIKKVGIPKYFDEIIIPQLGDYFDLYPVNFDSDPRACCPLHDEETPSFRYYDETDSFYCFGCGKGGSIVNLHRYFAEKMNGKRPTDEEAVEFLYQYFIKGKESEEFIDKKTQKIDVQERLNTDKDIVRFNYYRFNIENTVTFDNNIKLDTKKQIWEILDNIDMLLSKDLIKVDNAEKYIRQKVNELVTIE